MVRLSLALLLAPLAAQAGGRSTATLDSYVNAYFLAEGKMADFDSELDSALKQGQRGLITRSSTYRDLIALRAMLDEKAHRIEQALEAAGRGSVEVAQFRSRLDGLDPLERLAVTDLLPELKKAPLELPVFFATLDDERGARSVLRPQMLARVSRARRDSALSAEVRALSATLDFGGGEENGVLQIRPSPGLEGTISGASFPANTWALTFDDGPHEKYTPMVFANLQEFKKKASFMWLVQCLEENSDLPRQAKALGFPTNDHSWTHENLDKAKPAELTKEVVNSSEKDAQFYGERPRFFRLPYGAGLSNKNVRALIAENGMIHVFWNVDSLDWKDKNPATILARVKKQMLLEKHGIILFHDIHPQSVEGSKLVLKYSATLDGTPAALRWVTIPEIVDEMNGDAAGGPVASRGFSLDPFRKVR
ncbi:MAG: polysaccharide deacetylase family protein [Bdellovibrionota bacterium]